MQQTAIKPAVPALLVMSAAEQRCGAAGDGEFFTPDDLAAADQLVQLSVSGGGEAELEACSSSTLSSPRSVNNADAVAAAARKDEDNNAGVVDRRARKRYRLVTELYAATRRVRNSSGAGDGDGGGGKRKSRGAGLSG